MQVWDWRHAIEQSSLKPLTKLLLYTLANYMNSHGNGCYPSVTTLSKSTGLKNRAIYNHIKLAVSAGFLVRNKRRITGKEWAANEYQAAYPSNATLQRVAEGVHPGAALHIDENILPPQYAGLHADAGLHVGAGLHADAPLDVVVQEEKNTQHIVKGCTQVHTNSPIVVKEEEVKEEEEVKKKKKKNIYMGDEEKKSQKTEIRKLEDHLFAEFWEVYGYKLDRKDAEKAYKNALKQGVTHETIINGVRKYQDYCNRMGWTAPYIKKPAKWLNGHCWADKHPAVAASPVRDPRAERDRAATEYALANRL